MKFISYLLLIPTLSFAVDNCPVDKLVPFTLGNEVTDSLTHVESNTGETTKQKVSLSGNVKITKGQEKFNGEKVDYYRQTGFIKTDNLLTYGNPNFALSSKKSDFNLISKQGNFSDVEYYVSDGKIIGSAKKVFADRINNIENLEQATYSTCARDNPSWYLKSKRLYLNHTEEEGESWGNVFYIKDIPVLYFPYLSFPLSDKRKTGFLFPQVNHSKSRGIDMTIPYYINIAPNQDLTLYPRLMSKRGFMLGAEYRYLLPELKGDFSGNYLFNDFENSTNRWAFYTNHTYTPTSDLSISLLYQQVSDTDYIKDFTKTLDLSGDSFLERHLKINYNLSDDYKISAQIKGYQVADSRYTNKNKPYSILPRIAGKGEWFLGDYFSFLSHTELTNFQKEAAVSGIRLDQNIELSYFYENSYYFLNPKLGYRFTYYNLKRQNEGKDDIISRSIPNFSIDTGLYFSRQMNWFGSESTQTLEPRLFYLYTPYEDQSDIPDFDTSRVDSSYDWMFLRNRFNGKDRIGDANQLTTAISTTITDNKTGKEQAKFSIGQIQYFQDRKVSLLDSINKKSRSNIITEGRININYEYKVRRFVHYELHRNRTEKSMLGIQYSPFDQTTIGLSYLYDENYYEQLDLTGTWKINDYWKTFWRFNYSLRYDEPIDMMTGVEYSDCCWSTRLLVRNQRDGFFKGDNSEIESETSVFLEFEFKGLGKIGNDTTTALEKIIPGYDGL